MRRRAERLVLATMVFVGIGVVVADALGLLDKLAPSGTIAKVTLLVLCTVTLFLLMELERLYLLDDIQRQLKVLDITGIAEQRRREHYAGVTCVHRTLADTSFAEHLHTAREITILNTWVPNLKDIAQALEAAVARGARVRILLLFPNSDVASLRDEALRTASDPTVQKGGRGDEPVKQGVQDNLDILEDIAIAVPADQRGCLEVRLYNSLPAMAVYRTDDRYFVGMFVHGKLAIRGPQLEIDGTDTVLGAHVHAELTTLWTIGRRINPVDWQRQLGAISFSDTRG